MNEAKNKMPKPEEELIDVLLDFIIVSANLAKKITLAMRDRQIKEGGNEYVKNERNGHRDQRTQGRGSRH